MTRGAFAPPPATIATLSCCVVDTTASVVGAADMAVGSAAIAVWASAFGGTADVTVGATKAVGRAVALSSKDGKPTNEVEPS